MIEFLNSVDTQLYLFFNGMHLPFLDRLMMMVTGKFIWIPMYATIFYILFKNFKLREAIFIAIGIILAVTLADQICSTVLRPIFHRLRPSNPENPLSQFAVLVNDYRGGRYGFPSCHAANSFALAAFLFMVIKRFRFRAFIVGWAVLNTYSRVYLGVHYPGDLFVGAVIGSIIGYGMFRFTEQVILRKNIRKENSQAPVVHLPALFSIAGAKNPYVRPSDVMLCIGGFTLFLIAVIAVI